MQVTVQKDNKMEKQIARKTTHDVTRRNINKIKLHQNKMDQHPDENNV